MIFALAAATRYEGWILLPFVSIFVLLTAARSQPRSRLSDRHRRLALGSQLALCQLQVVIDHLFDQFRKTNLRPPAQFGSSRLSTASFRLRHLTATMVAYLEVQRLKTGWQAT